MGALSLPRYRPPHPRRPGHPRAVGYAVAVWLIWAGGLAPDGLAGQSSSTVAAGVELQRVGFDDADAVGVSSLSLLTASWAARFRIDPRLEVQASGHWARAEKELPDGSTRTLSGLTDTDVAATLRLAGGDVALTGLVALPTGSPTLDLDEVDVAANIASDLIPFRVNNWGSGGGLGARVAVSRRIGSVGAGMSAGYFVGRDFTPLGFLETEYRPGSSWVVRGVVDGNPTPTGKASLQLTYRRYGEDRLDGNEVFRAGDRFQALASYAFAVRGGSSALVYAGAMHRSPGEVAGPTATILAGTLGLSGSDLGIGSRTLLVAGGGARLRAGGVRWLPGVDLRLVRSEDAIDQGYELGLGGTAEIDRGATTLVPALRIHLGHLSVEEDVAESGYLGVDVGLTVRFRP